jgi:hypothetical protein
VEVLPGVRGAQRRGGSPGWYRSIPLLPTPVLLPCPAPLCHSLVAATCWILVLLCPRSEARGHEWAAAGVLVRGVLLRSTQESVVASDGMR